MPTYSLCCEPPVRGTAWLRDHDVNAKIPEVRNKSHIPCLAGGRTGGQASRRVVAGFPGVRSMITVRSLSLQLLALLGVFLHRCLWCALLLGLDLVASPGNYKSI